MDNLGILSGLPMPNLLFPCCSPFMYSALVMATLYGCRCLTCKKTNALKRSMAMTDSQRNDLIFNQMSKCPRLDQQQTSPVRPPRLDQQHTSPVRPSPSSSNELNNSRKCTGTQTLFSSFVPSKSLFDNEPTDPYFRKSYSDEEPCFILDLDRHMMGKSHPTRNGKTRATSCNENELNNIPLNLTVPSVKTPIRPIPMETSHVQWSPPKSGQKVLQINGQSDIPNVGGYNGGPGWRAGDRESFRPVIKLDNSKINHQTNHDIWSEPKQTPKIEQQNANLRQFSSSVECEKGVEEHFKRSLGKDYPQRLGNKNLPSPPISTASMTENPISLPMSAINKQLDCQSNMSITGAVDDHFAKSLGQTWTKLKSQSPPIDPEGQPGSVDDHFAKALGDMWFKIKAEKSNS